MCSCKCIIAGVFLQVCSCRCVIAGVLLQVCSYRCVIAGVLLQVCVQVRPFKVEIHNGLMYFGSVKEVCVCVCVYMYVFFQVKSGSVE